MNLNNNIQKKIKRKYIYLINIFIILMLIVSIFRISIIGQAIDDIFFSFLFGFNKYLIYLLIIIKIFFVFKNKKIKIKKNKIFKIIWIIFNIFWLTGLIVTIWLNIETGNFWNYYEYNFEKILPRFFESFKKESIIFQEKVVFLKFNKNWGISFITSSFKNGLINLIIATFFNYLYFVGSIILNIFSWFFLINYIIYNQPFFLFFKKEKKDLIKWNNMKNNLNQTNFISGTMNQIKDENMTIEIPIFYKINQSEINMKKNNIENIKNEHKNKIKQKINEKTIKFEWEIPEIYSNNKLDFNKYKNNEIKDIKIKENNLNEKELIYSNKKDFENDNYDSNEILLNENKKDAKINKYKINNVLKTYNVNGEVYDYNVGPSITKFEILLKEGVKVQKFLDLKKEFEIKLADKRIRIEAPIPGKSAVGIEIPNKRTTLVSWKPLINELIKEKGILKLLIGKNVTGNVKFLELQKLPHLLIAGSTGGGKSVCLLSIISSLILKNSPEELKLLLIDPKKVELSIFSKIPHLVSPIITENKIAVLALKKVLEEIKERYKKFQENGVNKISDYNKKNLYKKMPYFVIIIDELADLIFSFKKEIEETIVKIAQIARAAGVFLVIATQRPSIDIVTGLIKVNIPGRIAFKVVSSVDSRTILNKGGAEKLLGLGDMLILNPNNQSIERAQGVFINNEDINSITKFWINKNYKNFYWKNFENLNDINDNFYLDFNEFNEADNEIYYKVLKFLEYKEDISISLIQRRFSIGFNRAAKIIDKLKIEGKIIKSGAKYKILKN